MSYEQLIQLTPLFILAAAVIYLIGSSIYKVYSNPPTYGRMLTRNEMPQSKRPVIPPASPRKPVSFAFDDGIVVKLKLGQTLFIHSGDDVFIFKDKGIQGVQSVGSDQKTQEAEA